MTDGVQYQIQNDTFNLKLLCDVQICTVKIIDIKTLQTYFYNREIDRLQDVFEWIGSHDDWDERKDLRCILGTLAEMIRRNKLQPEMLLAFEEEVIHVAWQNTPSVFHFFNDSDTLAQMYKSVDATHSCTIPGSISKFQYFFTN